MLLQGTVKRNIPSFEDIESGDGSYNILYYTGMYFLQNLVQNEVPNTGPDVLDEVPNPVPTENEHMPNFFWRESYSRRLMGTIVNDKFDGRIPKFKWHGKTYYPAFCNAVRGKICWTSVDYGPKHKIQYDNPAELATICIFENYSGALVLYDEELQAKSQTELAKFSLEASQLGRLNVNDRALFGDVFYSFHITFKSPEEINETDSIALIELYPSDKAKEIGLAEDTMEIIYDVWIEKPLNPDKYNYSGSGKLYPIVDNEFKAEYPEVYVGSPVWKRYGDNYISFLMLKNLNLSKIYPKKKPFFATSSEKSKLIITSDPKERYLLIYFGKTYTSADKPTLDETKDWVFKYKKNENDPNAPETMPDVTYRFYKFDDGFDTAEFKPGVDGWYDDEYKKLEADKIDENDSYFYKWTFQNMNAFY